MTCKISNLLYRTKNCTCFRFHLSKYNETVFLLLCLELMCIKTSSTISQCRNGKRTPMAAFKMVNMIANYQYFNVHNCVLCLFFQGTRHVLRRPDRQANGDSSSRRRRRCAISRAVVRSASARCCKYGWPRVGAWIARRWCWMLLRSVVWF